jgi:uncharacterized membrane protein
MKFIRILIVIFILISSFCISRSIVEAQEIEFNTKPFENTLEGEVAKIIKEKEVEEDGEKHLYQELEVFITKGLSKDKTIVVKNGEFEMANTLRYKKGDKLVITHIKDLKGDDLYYIADYIRRDALLLLFLIFAVLAVIVGKMWGITSILGMAFSFFVIFKFVLPEIITGANPVLIAILGSVFIIPVTFYMSHGFNKKTHVAILGTVISLVITGLLAFFFVEASKLTGFASEEASFLEFEKHGLINIKGLLLAGIIIGTLGILDDVTISQSAIVFQLKEANNKLGFKKLYSQAMRVGHDHVSSMVNTLVLVYAGAAMPLLLLFVNNPRPFSEIINYEIIADEIVRTLVGSIGLILAVPITTLLAVYTVSGKTK